jgi:hypothetical protein
MGEVVRLVIDDPDSKEIGRREKLAWRRTDRA